MSCMRDDMWMAIIMSYLDGTKVNLIDALHREPNGRVE